MAAPRLTTTPQTPTTRGNRTPPRRGGVSGGTPGNHNATSSNGQQQRQYSFLTLGVGFLLGVVAARTVMAIFQTNDEFRQFQTTEQFVYEEIPPPQLLDNLEIDQVDESSLITTVEEDKEEAKNNNQETPTTGAAKQKIILVKEFERQEGIVVATKIHGPRSFFQLRQSLCLFTYAYNNRVNYDIVVFTARPLDSALITELEGIVAPAKVSVVIDNPGLQQMVSELSPERRKHLLERCNNSTEATLSWSTGCTEDKTTDPLSYNWQAEFRALHVWTNPALADYRYMMWLDSDGFCTKVWKRDPIAYMIQEQLVIFFAHFPMGASRGADFQERFLRAFNGTTLCKVGMTDDGRLYTHMGMRCPRPVIQHIHGFFHITDLNFYRSDRVMNWARILIGDTKFSRRYDDQLGVTAPAAVWAPNKSLEMELNGFDLDVFHNGRLDGKDWSGHKNFATGFWHANGTYNFPEAFGKCQVDNNGR